MMKTKDLMIIMVMTTFIAFGCLICPPSSKAENAADSYIEQSAYMNSDMELYIRSTRRSIKAKWYPSPNSFEKEATINLTVDRQGQLVDCKIADSSLDEAFDASLIKAAKEAKYEPLPKSFPYSKADITLSFGMQRRSVTK